MLQMSKEKIEVSILNKLLRPICQLYNLTVLQVKPLKLILDKPLLPKVLMCNLILYKDKHLKSNTAKFKEAVLMLDLIECKPPNYQVLKLNLKLFKFLFQVSLKQLEQFRCLTF